MFDNIGGKIKVLAKVICWIGIIISVAIGIILIGDSFSGRYTNTEELLIGIAVIVLGSLFSWIGSFVLFGFGELVENSTYIAESMHENKTVESSGEWFCRKCGYLNEKNATVCNKCGTKR